MITFTTEDRVSVEQRTTEWNLQRLGNVTASRVADILAKTKTGASASRQNYLIELALQRVTGAIPQSFTSDAMQWGIDNEAQARVAYEIKTGNFVDQVGFIKHPTIEYFGASPDGIIDSNGLVEIKCMQPKGHWEVIKTKEIPKNYWIQQQAQLSCTNREWNDYVGFNPIFPDRSQLFIKRTYRDEVFISEMEAEIKKFLDEVEVEVKQMKGM
jgi:putative phage-type endonuclease